MYTQLRHFILSEDLQRELPGWPYPLLFQGEEISRDIFFLDPLVELRILKLGRNPVRDVDYLRYASLNRSSGASAWTTPARTNNGRSGSPSPTSAWGTSSPYPICEA